MHAFLFGRSHATQIPPSPLHVLPQLGQHRSGHAFLFELENAPQILPSMLHGLPQLDQHRSGPPPNSCHSGAVPVPPRELGNTEHIHLGLPWLMHAFLFGLSHATQIPPSTLHGLPQLDQNLSDSSPNSCLSGAVPVPPC